MRPRTLTRALLYVPTAPSMWLGCESAVAKTDVRPYVWRVSRLLLLFILVPLLDIFLLLELSGVMGVINTVALVIFTGVLGASLFRRAWAEAWTGWQRALAEGRLPEEGVLGAAMLLVGGALLITPGVVTDVIGLTLLLGPSRRWLAARLKPYLLKKVQEGRESGRVRVIRMDGLGDPMHDGPFTDDLFPGHPPRMATAPKRVEMEVETIETEAEVVGRRVRVERRPQPRKQVLDADFVVED